MRVPAFPFDDRLTREDVAVRYDLADGGVGPVTLRQLLAAAHEEVADEVDRLLDVPLEHGQTNGRVDVREAVATMHPGCAPDQVLITNGATEALFLALSVLLEPGDRVVVATPVHEPIVSAARAIGCQIVEWPLAEAGQWRFDPDALDRLAPPGTKLILLNSPHNPTGAALSDEELAHILAHAERIGAWVVNDEVYRDLPHWDAFTGTPAAPVADGGRRVSVASLSKSVGLPGLRLGWLVGPPDLVSRCWGVRGYTSLSPPRLAQDLALTAFRARPLLLDRAAQILRSNHAALSAWTHANPELVRWPAPSAGPLTLLDYQPPVPADKLCTILAEQHGVLVVPGTRYGRPHALRLGLGGQPDDFAAGLALIKYVLTTT